MPFTDLTQALHLTREEHYAKAEEQLAFAAEEWDDDPDLSRWHMAKAQVHATLAASAPKITGGSLTKYLREDAKKLGRS